MNKKTVRDIDLKGKRVLVRVDFNVPLSKTPDANGKYTATDDTRIRAALPTIKYLLEQDARVILCSHLGRPKGPEPKSSLAPAARVLGELLNKSIALAPDCIGPDVEQMARALHPGGVLLLENVRFHPEEEKNDPAFAKQLAALAEVYVNDAFGSAHRAHASTDGVAKYLPAVGGFLMEKELEYLAGAVTNPARPFIALLGGAKISDKIGVIENLLAQADKILIGGGMANTFFKAQGINVADSLVEDVSLETAKGLLAKAGGKIVLPADSVLGDKFDKDAAVKTVKTGDGVPAGWRILDIGPATIESFAAELKGAKLIVWNGPMGVFEFPAFAKGTNAVAKLLAESGATTVIGGGESVAAVEQAGLAGKMSHISTGGGASLELLEGKVLPGVAALMDK
ncbi:MAG TPA: phosphoglycerate kinase [Anaerolineales bacterium]|nr:phosphoglycerate kinase [Anaerolineales bacterium]